MARIDGPAASIAASAVSRFSNCHVTSTSSIDCAVRTADATSARSAPSSDSANGPPAPGGGGGGNGLSAAKYAAVSHASGNPQVATKICALQISGILKRAHLWGEIMQGRNVLMIDRTA